MKATIFYWASQNFKDKTGYEHNQEIPVSEIFNIQSYIFGLGLNTMLYHASDDKIILFVDDKRFGQR